MQTLSGRTCVFSGATAGDGVDTVKALCAGGMNVVMMTHQEERARALVEEINACGFPGRCAAVGARLDGPAEENPETYEALCKEYGSVDVIISNTGGIGKDIPMEELSDTEMMRIVNHLLTGAFNMLKAALPSLKKSNAPRVIFMSTVEGVYGGVHESFSNAVAKGAVHSLSLNAAARLAPSGITVNCIAKGPIPRVEEIKSDDVDVTRMKAVIPMGRLGSPQDLAAAVCFLASEESGFITGQTLSVSGGLELRP